MPQRVVALELDAHEFKAAVIETTFRDYRVVGFYREAVAADDGSPSDQLRRFLKTHKLEGSTVLSSLPGDLVALRTVFLPFRDRKRLDQTVPFELETQVPFGLDEVVIDYHILHRDGSGCNVLAALVQRSDLEAHLKMLSDAGVDPKVVDLAPLATLNVLSLVGTLPDTFAYVGGNARRITVALYRNHQLVGLRTVVPSTPTSPAETEATAAGNGHPPEEVARVAALVTELRWTLLALNGAPLDARLPCFLTGDSIEFDQIGQGLSTALDISVRRLDQSPLRNVAPALRSDVACFASPLGLALREVEAKDALGVNFRRDDFAYHRGQDEVRRAFMRTGFLAVLVVVLMMANNYMAYEQMSSRLTLVQGQVRSVFTQTLPEVKRVTNEREQLQAEIDAAQKKLQLLGGLAPAGGATAVDVMRTIASAIPQSLKIDVDEYLMDPEGVRIKAKTDAFETADAIKQQLVNTHAFADVQVKDVKAAPDGKGVDFRLAVSLNKEGSGAPPKEGSGAPPKP